MPIGRNGLLTAGAVVLAAVGGYAAALAGDKVQTPRPVEAPPKRGRTLYVATSGADDNPGTSARPLRTLRRAVPMLRPGDTLYLRAGTYAEPFDTNAFAAPSGTSWSAPITIAAHPGEAVTLRPGSGPYVVRINGPVSYLVLEGLTLDGSGVSDSGVYLDGITSGAPTHVRLRNCEVKSCPRQGVMFGAAAGRPLADHNELIRVRSHDNGRANLDHGFYISTSHNLLDGCESYANAGHGIQVFKQGGTPGVHASHNTVRSCKIHDNGAKGFVSNIGLELNTGDGNLAYNNLIWRNGTGITVEYGATNARVYNNTIYQSLNKTDAAIRIGYAGGARDTKVRNNIIWGSRGADLLDYGKGTAADHNTSRAVDPLFVNAAAFDFRLRAGSPAIDRGVTLAEVPADHDGVPRARGRAYDLGAYER